MSTSTALLQEKYRRAMAFGKYLETHPDQDALDKELQRSLTMYRIALSNCLDARLPKEPKKKRVSK